MLDLLREIGQTMRNNKLRTALTGFAVAWGIFMLIILLGLSRGVYNSFDESASRQEVNQISIWNGSTTMNYKGYNKGRRIRLDASDIDILKDDGSRYIDDVTAGKYIDSAKVSTSLDYISDGIDGVFPRSLKSLNLDMVAGRFINQVDIDMRRKNIVLGTKSARLLFGPALPLDSIVGRRVDSMGLSWQVVGIYSREWNEDESFVPFSTAMMLSGNDGRIYSMRVLIDNVTTEDDGKAAEAEIRRVLAGAHEFDPDDEGAVQMWNQFTSYLSMSAGLGILDMAIWVIGLFTMLSGIVGVSNIMFVSVRERTHEIGIRRAIGARRRNILSQIVLESVAITTLFGYIGVVAGMLVMQVVSELVKNTPGFSNPTVDLSIALKVTVVLIVAGALAGLFPAIKATKVKPVEALRDE